MPEIPLSRSSALVLVGLLLAGLALVGSRLAAIGTATPPDRVVPLETVTAPRAARPLVVVHVVGAVRSPGLLRLPEGSRVVDAVERAGGATRKADLAGVNLAAPLVDGTQVVVPFRAGPGAMPSVVGGGSPPVGSGSRPPVSLSSATAEELDALPGVGPVTAQRILDYRAEHGPFASVDDLDAVPGIGPARIEQLRDLVTP
ncbi:MAG: ComEA family DNA-binding protein [Gaiellaceae bacterium]|nr:ComEA family DNA-binding protein [Gaiellaceae bacterium]